jgi:hypothetical protein
MRKLADGSVRFGFTNVAGGSFVALGASNVALPVSNWTMLGSVAEVAPGRFEFSDSQAAIMPQRFYRVRAE